ncbi:MAG: hypothetical protein MJ252_09225 [archaeon]|nr:hypothetical protein [archaeon]
MNVKRENYTNINTFNVFSLDNILPINSLSIKSESIQIDNNSTNTTNISENKLPINHCFFLIPILFLIDFSLTITIHSIINKYKKSTFPNGQNKEGKKKKEKSIYPFKIDYLKYLFFSNLVRTISLVFLIMTNNSMDNTPKGWLTNIFIIIPAFFYISAYMFFFSFFIEIYYSEISLSQSYIKPCLLYIFLIIIMIISLVAFFCFWLKSFLLFFKLSEIAISVLFLCFAVFSLFYCKRIKYFLLLMNHNNLTIENSEEEMKKVVKVIANINFLFKFYFGLFALKSIFGIFYSFNLIGIYEFFNLYQFVSMLLVEILPTVIYIFIIKNNEDITEEEELPRQTELEMEVFSRIDSLNTSHI